ncbi:uncharacterized protein isoform X3 [Takifugu rubripes]|uniref:uncharacterized protein isoform X3 n=1 Tax=Takifugu rubripes TaxID=31033 RepID=UPI00114573BF|nr:uncharacterized protein LOC105419489 isoform X3 [Takifugu rubripes]
MRNLCFTSLCFILSFYASNSPDAQLTCNVTKNPDGSFTYRLVPAPTVTENTSFRWAKNSITFAEDGDITAEVLNLMKDSVTLKLCQENVTYENHGANPQEASCHVNCSGHERTTPSADHRWCPSDDWCPPVQDVVLLVLVLVELVRLMVELVRLMVVCFKIKKYRIGPNIRRPPLFQEKKRLFEHQI